MKEIVFRLDAGKEVPQRLDGQEIRYTLPETLDEVRSVCGGNEAVIVSVFNEGFNLNHRQKIAKRFAAREGSTIESITSGMLAHVPGVRAVGSSTPRVPSATKQVVNDALAALEALDPAQAALFRERLAAVKPTPKAKKVEQTTETAPATPVAESAPVAAKHKK